jgi:hypothetical protein
MRKKLTCLSATALSICAAAYLATAPFEIAQSAEEVHPMTFFVTSVPIGDGANLGGLEGADAHCQMLAEAAGAGEKTWHAYLSTQPYDGQPAINARDRIGEGPWYNANGVMIARDNAHLHGDTLELARLGNNVTKVSNVNEKGEIIYGFRDFPDPRDTDWEYIQTTPYTNRHEILTGSQPNGMAYLETDVDHTCHNWTSNAEGTCGQNVCRNGIGPMAQVGMSDRNGGGNGSWNSAHPTGGCSQANLTRTHGQGFFYCFAID